LNHIVYYTTAILLLSVAVIVVLERKFPYRPGLKIFREGFWVDLVWYTLIQSYFLQIIIFKFIGEPLDARLHLSPLHVLAAWPVFWQVVLFLVMHDFYIYWFHRWQHHSKILWKTHEAHHSNKDVDWLAGSRSHVLEILINQSVEFIPIIILLGPQSPVIPIKALLDAMWGMYIHSNINVKAGKLQYFINGPEMHQWHHADQREVFYANYSTKFAMWDWLFGTAYLPNKKPERFGLYYDYPKDYFLQNLFAVKQVDERKLLRNKAFRFYYRLRPNLVKFFIRKAKPAEQNKAGQANKTPVQSLAENLK